MSRFDTECFEELVKVRKALENVVGLLASGNPSPAGGSPAVESGQVAHSPDGDKLKFEGDLELKKVTKYEGEGSYLFKLNQGLYPTVHTKEGVERQLEMDRDVWKIFESK